jgi:hypothetical protein
MGTLIKRGYIQLPKMREKPKRIKEPKEHTKKKVMKFCPSHEVPT